MVYQRGENAEGVVRKKEGYAKIVEAPVYHEADDFIDLNPKKMKNKFNFSTYYYELQLPLQI